jgi:hypothetical protein
MTTKMLSRAEATEKLQIHLLAELRATFPDDPSAPGIMISQVKSRRFYAAAVRFREPIGQGREVLATGRAGDLPTAIRALAADWSERRWKYLREQKGAPS